ncbi:hypothetical protein ACSCBZ_35020 [Streptomyces niveiscabiei]|uniref:hypothetical protein n=2 Tax=Streptomyces niveiscabiei TaxID=164115 RepID=UPI003EB91571
MDELGVWAASPVDAASLFGLGAHFWRQLTDADHLVSLPVTPLVYKDAEFRLEGGLDARRAAVLAEFSELANRVPTHPVWTPPVTPHLWDVYGEVLAADLARSSLTPEERTRYDAAIDYLYDPDPATGDPVPSAALRAYRAARQTWTDADREYRRAEDAAWMSTDPAARDRWARIEEPDLRQKRDDAMDAWQTAGRKAEVEDALRESSELAAKSPSATWKRHRDAFNPNAPGQFSTAPNGLLYAPTYYSPSAALDTPWTEVRLTRELFLTLADQAPAAFSAALGHRATDHSVSQLAFEYRVVSVVRPWLDPPMDLFGSRAWRFSSGVRELSDGGDPPKGRCPSYVESIALARNVHLTREAHTYSPAAVAENNWPPMGTFDFDTGRMNVGMDQASVRWEWTGDGTGAQLVPGTDTGIAALGTVDYDTLDGRALDRLRYRDAPVPGTGLAPGSVFAVRTRRKKLVKIQVLAYGPELAIRDQEYELTASSMVASDTAPDDVFIAAFACRRLPKSPDPDGGLQW